MKRHIVTLAFLLSTTLCAQQRREVGFVVRLTGEWVCLGNHRDLRAYERLYSGDVIAAGKNMQAGDSIQIALLAPGDESSRTEIRKCVAAGVCDKPYQVRAAADSDNWMLRVVAAAERFVQLENREDVFAATRGTLGPEEAILNGDALDFGAALGPVSPGEYTVKWTRMANGHAGEEFTSALVWSPPLAHLDLPHPPADGVYRVQLMDESGETVGAPAFVAVLRGAALQHARESFLRVQKSIAGWRAQPQPGDTAAYRSLAARALMAIDADPALTETPHE